MASEALQWASVATRAKNPCRNPLYELPRIRVAVYGELKPIPTTGKCLLSLMTRIEARITNKTRGIALSNPATDSSSIRKTKYAVSPILRYGTIIIIADEVYRVLLRSREGRASRYDRRVDHIILCDSVSKRFSACGAYRLNRGHRRDVITPALKLGQAGFCPTLK